MNGGENGLLKDGMGMRLIDRSGEQGLTLTLTPSSSSLSPPLTLPSFLVFLFKFNPLQG